MTHSAAPDKVDFGDRLVTRAEKTRRVNAVFDSVAARYDLMNDLMSFGIHRLWKRFAVSISGVRAGHCVLDVACGSGDIAGLLLQKVGTHGQVVATDINAAMLVNGRDKLFDAGHCRSLTVVQADAESLPFADNVFDALTIAFGLRNVTDKAAALCEFYRVLKPAAALTVLEFSHPAAAWLQRLYQQYSSYCIPALGEWVTGDRASYDYLVQSIARHPSPDALAGMLHNAAFAQVKYHNLSGGIVAVHRGVKI